MLPRRVAEVFGNTPSELVRLCRPHAWSQLTEPPGQGMRSIRDVLAHLFESEVGWIGHVVQGQSRQRIDPAAFSDVDELLTLWLPRRQATLKLVLGLTAEDRAAGRILPWDAKATATVEEIVWHVVTHEQYHRGQIFTRLALLGRRDLPDYDVLRQT